MPRSVNVPEETIKSFIARERPRHICVWYPFSLNSNDLFDGMSQVSLHEIQAKMY